MDPITAGSIYQVGQDFDFSEGVHFQTRLIVTEGLSVALADTETNLDKAMLDVAADMAMRGVRSGVVVLSQERARDTFGAVPHEWLQHGISMHRSTQADLANGGVAFVTAYLGMRDFLKNAWPGAGADGPSGPQSGAERV